MVHAALSSLSSSLQYLASSKPEVTRRSAGFHSTVWGGQFSNYSVDEKKLDGWERRAEELKHEAKRMLRATRGTAQEIKLIDALQRLGVAYHFEEEIEEELHHLFRKSSTATFGGDLHVDALTFRLLRQQGYDVPAADVFEKFMENKRRSFKGSLRWDVRGLLSLYEAAFLSIRGEDILDEAIVFSRDNLRDSIPHLDSHLRKHVERTLELPLHKRTTRLESQHYISFYEEDDGSKNGVILELAKLDFNLVQSLHQRELWEITKWWKEMDLPGQLPFIRDRVVECYFWVLGVYFEPHFSRCRVQSTKITTFVSAIDDMYDVYGTFEELQLFTDAIQRWDLEAMDQLPEYMKVCYHGLVTTMKEIEDELSLQGISYRVFYLKESIKTSVRAYFEEAKWYNTGHMPTFKEHVRHSAVSVGTTWAVILCYIWLGDVATKETFDWSIGPPKIILDSALIGRLLDDIQSNKFEQKRGHVASSVQCYMEEHGTCEQEACDRLREMVAMAWKDMNQACLKPTEVPVPLLVPAINWARTMEVIYQFGDGYTHSTRETKEQIASILVHPIPL